MLDIIFTLWPVRSVVVPAPVPCQAGGYLRASQVMSQRISWWRDSYDGPRCWCQGLPGLVAHGVAAVG